MLVCGSVYILYTLAWMNSIPTHVRLLHLNHRPPSLVRALDLTCVTCHVSDASVFPPSSLVAGARQGGRVETCRVQTGGSGGYGSSDSKQQTHGMTAIPCHSVATKYTSILRVF